MNPNRILIVDDEERNVKLVKGMIMSEQYEVATAACGQEARGAPVVFVASG